MLTMTVQGIEKNYCYENNNNNYTIKFIYGFVST